MAVINNKIIESTILFILIAGFFATSVAASKDIITGDIRPSNAKTIVIAKAPEDAAFKSLDTNGNGKISLQESIKESELALKFNDTDINHDGVITVDEFAMYQSNKEMNIN
jgi:Ca2+-binding EF-hand superfamily protein